MEFRSESVWLDARNALINMVCMALLVPAPLPLAYWFTFVAYETRMAVSLGAWPRWNSPHLPAADVWAAAGGIFVVVVSYSLAGGYAASAPSPWRRLLRAALETVALVGVGIALLYWDPFGGLDRQLD